MLRTENFLDISHTHYGELFKNANKVWNPLKKLPAYIDYLVALLKNNPEEYKKFLGKGSFLRLGNSCIGEYVFLWGGSLFVEGALSLGSVIIGRGCHIRHGAYIRGYNLIGDHVTIGHACEIKHSIIFDECQIPHFNYIGDSILGYKAHLGAGTKISNVKLTPGEITIKFNAEDIPVGLEKFGSVIGDHAQIGCNTVLNPGSLIGRCSIIYPCVNWRGYLPPNSIVKTHSSDDRTIYKVVSASETYKVITSEDEQKKEEN